MRAEPREQDMRSAFALVAVCLCGLGFASQGLAAGRALQFEDIAGKTFCWPHGAASYHRDGTYVWKTNKETLTGTWRLAQISTDGGSSILYTITPKGTNANYDYWEDGVIVKAWNPSSPISAHAANGPYSRIVGKAC
jgi:hypothetical protein